MAKAYWDSKICVKMEIGLEKVYRASSFSTQGSTNLTKHHDQNT